MATKKKKWFKSAFVEPKSDEKERPNVFANEQDSINFSELDLSIQTIVDTRTITPELSIASADFKSSNWIENFAPQAKADLAIHAKKISEVEDWFRSIKDRQTKAPQILIATGPSGSGKSTTIKIIAKEFGYTLSEWITPVDIEHIYHDRNGTEKITYSENQVDRFSQFLFQSSRYRSVFDTSNKRLVLVEDFPTVFLKDASSFEEVLERYSNYGKSPLIFSVTDTKSRTLNISFNLFTDEVRSRFNIASICFNPIAETMLKKGLKRICNIMTQPGFKIYYTEPNKEIIDSIVQSSQGDIRSAVINLHFASQKNSTNLSTHSLHDSISAKNRNKRTKNTKYTKQSKLKSMGTDENITMLHALGRVFNPKYQDDVDENGNKQFLHSPDEISSLLLAQPTTALNLIHHNYIGHFQSLDDIISAVDCLSYSDVILNEWRSESSADISSNLAVRGVMTSNNHPVTGRWMPIKSAKNNLMLKSDNEKGRKNSGTVSLNNFV